MIMRTKRYRSPNKNSYASYEDLEKMGLGSWLKDNAGNIATGAAGAGLMFVPGGQAAGVGLMASSVGGFANTAKQNRMSDQQDQMVEHQNAMNMADAQLQAQLSGKTNIPYAPTMCHGGNVKKRIARMAQGGTINYDGQYHEGPDGGVPVDVKGNYNPQNPSALVEKGEVGYGTPDGGTYIFSNSLEVGKNKTFARKAKGIQRKYRMRISDGKVVDPISKTGYDKEMQDLMNKQEMVREFNGLNEETQGLPEGKTGIHIKPENRGKFNALKKRTGKTTEELTHSKNPLTRKRAIFAQNAKKWKHEDGGELPMYDGLSFTPTGTSMLPKDQIRFRYNNLNLDTTLPTFVDYTRKLYDRGNYPTFQETVDSLSKDKDATSEPVQLDEEEGSYIAPWRQELIAGVDEVPDYSVFRDPLNKVPLPNPPVPVNVDWKNAKVGETYGNLGKLVGDETMNTTYTPYEGMNWYEAAIPAGVSALSNMVLARRAKRYNPRRLALTRQVPRTIDLENERASAREQANTSRAMNKRALLESGASASQYMGNVGAGNIGVQRVLGDQLGRSYQTEALTNLQSRQQTDQINSEMEMQEQLYNSQLDANKQAQIDQYYMNAMTAPLLGMKDYLSSRNDAAKLQMSQPNQQLMWEYDPAKPFGRRRRMVKKENTGR